MSFSWFDQYKVMYAVNIYFGNHFFLSAQWIMMWFDLSSVFDWSTSGSLCLQSCFDFNVIVMNEDISVSPNTCHSLNLSFVKSVILVYLIFYGTITLYFILSWSKKYNSICFLRSFFFVGSISQCRQWKSIWKTYFRGHLRHISFWKFFLV